jgi:hypothetical protein
MAPLQNQRVHEHVRAVLRTTEAGVGSTTHPDRLASICRAVQQQRSMRPIPFREVYPAPYC